MVTDIQQLLTMEVVWLLMYGNKHHGSPKLFFSRNSRVLSFAILSCNSSRSDVSVLAFCACLVSSD